MRYSSLRLVSVLKDLTKNLWVASVKMSLANFAGELKEIVWVNPTKAEEDAIIWLRSGVPAEIARQLRCL
jgi:hypothetical protein